MSAMARKQRRLNHEQRKPILFVGSSFESRETAFAIQENLEPHDADVKVWPQGIFKISAFGLDSLLETLKICDFGAFLFTPDDVLMMRLQKHRVVRDNVLFELGLFMGRLGRERTFIIVPAGADLHLPSDLNGLNVASYDATRKDKVAALGVACNKIRMAMKDQGLFQAEPLNKQVFSVATPIEATPPFASVFNRREKKPRKKNSQKKNTPLNKQPTKK